MEILEKVGDDQSRRSNIWLTGIPESENRKKNMETENCHINNMRKFPKVEVPESLDWKISEYIRELSTSRINKRL